MNRLDSPIPESSAGAKRKRTPIPEAAAGPPTIHGSGNIPQINYLGKAKSEKLRLIEGDTETIAEILAQLDEYEGVLQRQESLAANLGAKLMGPLLIKSIEKLFDGPIKILQSSFGLEQSPVTWLDIVTVARDDPSKFALTEQPPGVKTCRIWMKGGQIEFSEDDYRLLMSKGPERMIPTQPLAEDEAAELGTVNILESRMALVIKKADAVASKARQFNYHLKGRKGAIISRQATEQSSSGDQKDRTFSPQPFSTVSTRSPAASANGEVTKVQQHLLEQFLSSPPGSSRRQSIAHSRPKASRVSASIEQPPASFHNYNGSQEPTDRRLSAPQTSPEDGGGEGQHRVLMAGRIEKLAKGETIYPPCDRCRRLKFDCTKHLTACTPCTKKHAKCSWRDVKEGEFESSVGIPPKVASESGVVGYVNVDSTSFQTQVDPGLRAPLPGISGPARDMERRAGIVSGTGTGDEHAMLTHIASAAAAAGNQ